MPGLFGNGSAKRREDSGIAGVPGLWRNWEDQENKSTMKEASPFLTGLFTFHAKVLYGAGGASGIIAFTSLTWV